MNTFDFAVDNRCNFGLSVGRVAYFVVLLWLVGGDPRAVAQTAESRHNLSIEHLKKQAEDMSARCLTDIATLQDWERERPRLRSQLLDMIGLHPLPKKTPLEATLTGTLERPEYSIEKIVFQSMPGLYVTGNFYLPKNVKTPLPTVLYLCGHSPHPQGAKVPYQNRAAWFASHGYACLILDTLEFAEVEGLHHGIHDLNMWYWLSLGYTPAGPEVWNGIRALDYLETRPEVDMKRIGVTGTSGGGAITWFLAAVDERVAVAAPTCSTYTLGSQARHWLAAGQCDCIYYHNSCQQDFPTVAALIAPRPLVICSGIQDGIFPPDGYHEVFQRAKRIYDLYSVRDEPVRIREVDDDVKHSDAPLFRKEVRQWMNRWLREDFTPLETVPNPPAGPESGEALACLTSLPENPLNFQIHRKFIQTASPKLPDSLAAWNLRKEELLENVKKDVFGWFPKADVPFDSTVLSNSFGWAGRYANHQKVEFTSEIGTRVVAQLLTCKKDAENAPLLVYVKRAKSIYAMDLDQLLPLLGRYNIVILYPRFTEHPIQASLYAEIERTASWTGRTIASMQVWDIMRTVDWAIQDQKLKPSSIVLFGKGEMGVPAIYAALFDQRVTQVVLDNPPGTHWQGSAMVNVLRHTDIVEMAAALAPRQLSCVTPFPSQFEFTKKIYQLHDLAGSLRETVSLPAALNLHERSR